MSHEYRDRIYIRKDIILKLTEYGDLNQTSLLSYCGLNLVKHKPILDDMEQKGLITKTEEPWGNKKTIIKYRVTERGKEFCRRILEPYEEMFPRKGSPFSYLISLW
ncbi:MAG TPA: winged helix-turn-helix domain-containing protein [Nitrososphaeraceae archaeon]